MLNMTKKKVFITGGLVLVILAVAAVILLLSSDVMRPSVKLSEEFSTYEALIEHSPVVITATVVSDNKEFVYDDITFAITEVEVNDCVRGEVSSKTLRIMQTKAEEDPYLAKSTNVLLFLSEYKGPVAENVYVINGLYNGQFTIKDNTLYEAGLNLKVAPILKNTDLESVLSDVRNTAYKDITSPSSSDEDVEETNEREKELESQLEEGGDIPTD